MRTRTRDLSSVPEAFHSQRMTRWYRIDTNERYDETNTSYDREVRVNTGEQTTHDVVTPDFAVMSKRGVIINNPYDSTITKHQEGVLRYNQYYRARDYYWKNRKHVNDYGKFEIVSEIPGIPDFLQPEELDVTHLRNITLTSAWGKVSAAPMQLLVTAAEARKTVDLLIDLFKASVSVFRKARRGRRLLLSGAISASKAANIWLQCRYGLRPLYYEVRNAIEAYNALNKRKRSRFTAFAADEAEDENEMIHRVLPSSDYHLSRRVNRRVEVRSGVLVESEVENISFNQAFGLDEAFQTAWELIPYSFVVDWFVNTADFIASWSPKVDVRPLASWTVVRDTTEQRRFVTVFDRGEVPQPYRWFWESVPGTEITDFTSTPEILETKSTERFVHPDKPAIPSLNVRLNVAKLIDILALLKNLRKFS